MIRRRSSASGTRMLLVLPGRNSLASARNLSRSSSVQVPLSFISNTYFPLESDHPVLGAIIASNPIYHLAETCRGLLVRGDPDDHLLWLLALGALYLVLAMVAAQKLTRRRVLGE